MKRYYIVYAPQLDRGDWAVMEDDPIRGKAVVRCRTRALAESVKGYFEAIDQSFEDFPR